MPWINTATLNPQAPLPPHIQHQVYCGLDSCVTKEVWGELQKLGDLPAIYSFERALQAPYLEIMRRGFKVDEISRRVAAESLTSRIAALQAQLNEYALAVWDKGLNPRSPKQLLSFFYDCMDLPRVFISQKGQKKLSTNREALEKLEQYLYARPIVSTILSIRELAKQLEVFETDIDSDGRFRTSYNIAGTETGRPSSSSNAFGTGGNAQNIAPPLRYVFVADPGFKLCVIDLEQVEARDVGFFEGCLFGDWTYLDSCECLTQDHEVLTKEGWKSIATMPEELMIWNKVNGQFSFEEVQSWNKGTTNYLINLENQAISVFGTANHMMPVWSGGVIKKKPLKELRNLTLTAPNTGEYKKGELRIKEAKLIAAFQADGTRDLTGKIHWTFMKARKIELMEKMLNELGYKYSKYNLATGATRFYLHTGQGQDKWPWQCGKEILNWDYTSIAEFCNSHYFWDGHFERSNVRITSVNKNHLDWLAVAYTLWGKMTSINKHKTDYWILTVKSRENHQYRSAKSTELNVLAEPVYCPTVSTGFFLVKRNDKIYISGNSGDLHTNNAKLIWPELAWTGDRKKDRELADGIFYRDFSYRDMAKRGGHLSNYSGTAWTASRSLKVPLKMMEEFQSRYCRGSACAFPAHQRWWQWTATQLQTTYQLVTPFGRRRHFFGRPGDDTTLREAIAFLPQSTTADRMNLGLWRVWRYMPEVQLLAQTYDSITFQYPEDGDEDSIINRALELIRVDLTAPNGRVYTVPGEAKIGWNWGAKVSLEDQARAKAQGKKVPRLNVEGLIKWREGERDKRVRLTGLKRRVM